MTTGAIVLMFLVAIPGQLVVALGFEALVGLGGSAAVSWLHSQMGGVVMTSVAYTVAAVAAIWLGWRFCGGGDLAASVGAQPAQLRTSFFRNFRYVFWGYGLMLAMTLGALLALMVLAPHAAAVKPTDDATEYAKTLHGWALAVFAFQTVLIGPILEELLCRGLMLNMLRSGLLATWGQYVSPAVATVYAVALSSFFFAAMHLSLSGFLPLRAAGIALAIVYRRSGNLFASIQMHMLMNALAILAILFQV
jgi:membrane protease YdiL (CAAX protease family)